MKPIISSPSKTRTSYIATESTLQRVFKAIGLVVIGNKYKPMAITGLKVDLKRLNPNPGYIFRDESRMR